MERVTQRMVGMVFLAGILSACACVHHTAPHRTVLFDEAHGQRFLVGQHGQLDLSNLSAVFQDHGLVVTTSRQEISDGTLSGVDAVVISGPFVPLTPAEIDATLRFLDRGGRLCVMLHIASPAAALLERLKVAISNGVIREREHIINDEPLNFHVTRLTPHDLTRNLDAFDAFGVWALMNDGENAAVIAQTGPHAWVDLNGNQILDGQDAIQSFGVVVAGKFGKGRFAVFGDDAIFQNQFLTGGNVVLAKNLAGWLAAAGGAE